MDRQLKPRPFRVKRSSGFSLIEMLVILAILAVLIVSFGSLGISGSMKITTTGQLIRDNLNLARNTAISRDRSVQVLFYKMPSSTSSVTQYRGMQLNLLDVNESNPTPLTKFVSFPSPLIIESSQSTYASLLYGTAASLKGNGTLSAYGATAFSYEGFTYRSDGSTDLATKGPNGDTWFVLVRSELDTATPPKNYFIVQVDPINGRTATFRP